MGARLDLTSVTRAEYADRVVRGGLPESVARSDPRRRGRFLDGYVQNLIDRDVRQLAEIERVPQLTTLVRLLAARSGQLVAANRLANELALSRPTVASEEMVDIYHYRDHNRVEVDVVLESRRGEVVGVEVKAASTVRGGDFHGLRLLAERLGEDFRTGVVFYTGTEALPFGPRMWAIPVCALWQSSAG